MKIEELRTAIETYPQRLCTALEEIAKAQKAIEELEEQIEDEDAQLSPATVEDVSVDVDNKQEDTHIHEIVLNLEYELSMLELLCEQIKGEVELEYRRNPIPGDKVTEATVTAYVKSNPRLVEAKERCLKKKYERDKANMQADMSRRALYAAERMEQKKYEQTVEHVTSPKLESLQEKLDEANVTLSVAEIKLEEVKASILPYQLLVQLYTAGLLKE
jgi:chromosome segregation ATPase